MKTKTSVIRTRCVPTLKDLMSAAVKEDIQEMAETAQVSTLSFTKKESINRYVSMLICTFQT